MLLRLTPALSALVLAGCVSSEPRQVAYDLEAAAPLLADPVPSEPLVPNGEDQTGGLAASTAQQSYNCRTVGNVTLCDAPADPNADETRYTN